MLCIRVYCLKKGLQRLGNLYLITTQGILDLKKEPSEKIKYLTLFKLLFLMLLLLTLKCKKCIFHFNPFEVELPDRVDITE